jgi:hypothetical protein
MWRAPFACWVVVCTVMGVWGVHKMGVFCERAWEWGGGGVQEAMTI